MILLLKLYWKQIAFAAILALAVFTVYNRGYDAAYKDRTSYYDNLRAGELNQLNTKIDNIEALSNELATQNTLNQNLLSKDLNSLTKNLSKTTPFIIKNGDCIPSEDFINTFNSIIARGNQK